MSEKLRASESFLERTGKMAGVGGWELDMAIPVTSSGRRKPAASMMSRPAINPAWKRMLNFYAPETRDVVQTAMDRAIVDGEGWDLQLPLITASKRKIWVRSMGAIEVDDRGRRRASGGGVSRT